MRHLQGFIGIQCAIRQFLASQDLIVDMIFEWLEFLVEVQTDKNRKSTTKNRKKMKDTEKTEGYRKFQIWDWVFFGFSWVATPPPPPPPHYRRSSMSPPKVLLDAIFWHPSLGGITSMGRKSCNWVMIMVPCRFVIVRHVKIFSFIFYF